MTKYCSLKSATKNTKKKKMTLKISQNMIGDANDKS